MVQPTVGREVHIPKTPFVSPPRNLECESPSIVLPSVIRPSDAQGVSSATITPADPVLRQPDIDPNWFLYRRARIFPSFTMQVVACKVVAHLFVYS